MLTKRQELLCNGDACADPPACVAKQLASGCLEIIMELRPHGENVGISSGAGTC